VDIAHNVARALQFYRSIPGDVQASVHHGVVFLTGHVEWLFQKRAAFAAVSQLKGVRRVMDYIVVTHELHERG
jgi:osmotically-inducible protein OsmY